MFIKLNKIYLNLNNVSYFEQNRNALEILFIYIKKDTTGNMQHLVKFNNEHEFDLCVAKLNKASI